jgi:polysaccharide export outer membrane protein
MENKYCLKIFLVDSDPFCLNIYQQRLNNLGYGDVTQFNSGNDCMDNLAQKPDVIFLDYRMDVANELELLKKIKRFNPDIYVVFTTSPEDIETVTNSLKYGAFDYVTKKDHEPEGAGKILATIYEIGEMLKNAQPSFIKKFPG